MTLLRAVVADTFGVRRAVLRTRLARDECVRRLRERCEPLFGWERTLDLPLIGRVSERGFSVRLIHRRGHIRLWNSWQTVATGRFVGSADGTEVQVRLAVHVFTKVLVAGMGLFIALLAPLMLLGSLTRWPESAPAALAAVLTVAGFVGFNRFGRAFSRGDADTILAVLREALEAREGPS